MSRLARVFQKRFGSTHGSDQVAKFGSLFAGSPVFTDDPALIQSLSNFLDGWYSAVIGGNAPAIQDMNALFVLLFYQLAYLFENGVPEWDSSTNYFIGSIVNSSGEFYVSLVDNNLNNAVTDLTKWALKSEGVVTTTGNYSVLATDANIRCTNTGGNINVTLPGVGTVPVGKRFTIKNRSSDGSTATVVGTIDGATNFVLNSVPATPVFDSITVMNNGTDYDLV